MDKISSTRLYVGDIIEVPLLNDKKGFIHYLFKDKWGDLIGIFDYEIPFDQKINLEVLLTKKFIFFPILTTIKNGLKLSESAQQVDKIIRFGMTPAPILLEIQNNPQKNYNWRIVGKSKVENFVYPNFIWKEGGLAAKNAKTKWYLYDGKKNVVLGDKLEDEYKSLEYLTNFPPMSIINLIQFKKDPGRELDKAMINSSKSLNY